jgi:cation diffusion facilitator CzcD-associated flavoprotein CzcO
MTPAPGYLEALRSPKTELITEGIACIVPEGVQLESGEVIKVDAIICATGFDTSFTPRFPLVGRNGNVQDRFQKEVPKSYMSCALSGVPNYFSKKTKTHSWVMNNRFPAHQLTSSLLNSHHGPECSYRTR